MVKKLNSRLTDWIQYQKLPEDILEYTQGNALSEFCPLCEFVHDNIPFTHWENDDTAETKDNTFICKECSVSLSEHLVRTGQIEIDYDQTSSRMKNLEAYIKNGTLPNNKYDFLSYGTKKQQCIFCEKKIIGVPWPLELPSGEDLYHYGGIVSVCDICYEWLISQNLGTSIHLNSNYDKCSRCKNVYPLVMGEYNQRKYLGSVGKHCCPQCFNEITKSNNYPIANLECDACGDDIRYDYTWLVDNPGDQFLPKRYCINCALVSHDPKNEIIIKHQEKGYYIFILNKRSGYLIFKVNSNTRRADLIETFNDVNIRYKTHELAEKASKRIYTLLKKENSNVGKQQELIL